MATASIIRKRAQPEEEEDEPWSGRGPKRIRLQDGESGRDGDGKDQQQAHEEEEEHSHQHNPPAAESDAQLLLSDGWLGSHHLLQASISAIDDRLLFLRVCEDLDARGIGHKPICVEPLVGGHMLRLTDISSVVTKRGVQCDDFFDNLLHCNIRLSQSDERSHGSSQLECTFVNLPVVPDFERSAEAIEADRRKPHTWVFTITPQRSRDLLPSMGQMIANSIEERLLIYCHIYVPVRRFARAYYEHLSQFCNVRAFTFHKFVLSYGDNGDLLFSLTWRYFVPIRTGKYALYFGQAPKLTNYDGKRYWNPHVLVGQLLMEKFNKDRDLVWLVNYLVNSHRSLASIQNFVRTQMHSTKAAAQLLGIDAAFPVEMMSHLTALDEQTIRLSYGPQLAMEFRLLQDNRVAVRDCTYAEGYSFGGVSLADFWRAQSQNLINSAEQDADADNQQAEHKSTPTVAAPIQSDVLLGQATKAEI